MQIPFTFEYTESQSKEVQMAIKALASESESGSRGAVFTRSEVVDFILDICGYAVNQPLYSMKLLEPSFGGGDFLIPIAKRLLASWRGLNSNDSIVHGLGNAIRAVELHHETFNKTSALVISYLKNEGVAPDEAIELAGKWLRQGDFLLEPLEGEYDFIIGNPPYIRQELIPAPLLTAYRSRYKTMYDRADIYIPFIERSLELLSKRGALGFICADRWLKNRYGGPLRCMVSEGFSLKIYVNMVDTPAFNSEVIAYPAITIITRGNGNITRVADRPQINSLYLNQLAARLLAPSVLVEDHLVREVKHVTNGSNPWLLGNHDSVSLVRRLENEFPLLEDTGCKVGIGVATGADKVFIGNYETLDVEDDRKLPLATTRDITTGEINWMGLGVINPFKEDGALVDLNHYPRLSRYLHSHEEIIARRHCAKKSKTHWYRTIDRITPSIRKLPKLLVPDIKGSANIVYEPGNLYPHHNLYYITSTEWDLRALQAVLLSSVARLFIKTYSTQMRGGFLRFQAQYIRRIRIPRWANVPEALKIELAQAGIDRNLNVCDEVTKRLYKIKEDEELSF